MSVSTPATARSRYSEPARADSPRRASGWAKLAVVAAILAASGGARLWQERRVERALEVGRASPFPLADLPMTIGSWEGREATMDPRIARITGSTDLTARRYVDRRTGVGLDVIVLYGPTADVMFHVPEVCYPSAGFEPLPGASERTIAVGGGALGPVPFRSLAFAKGEGGLADSQEVYYSLRLRRPMDLGPTDQPEGVEADRRGCARSRSARRLVGPASDGAATTPASPCSPLLVAEIEATDGPAPPRGVARLPDQSDGRTRPPETTKQHRRGPSHRHGSTPR